MSTPLWRSSHRLGLLRCDAVVVGAGVTGVSAALTLQRRGLSVIILEQNSLASAASGRNAGFLMRGAADNFANAVHALGHASASFLWRLTEENLAALKREGLESLPSYQPIPSCLLALTHSEADELRLSADLLSQHGFDASLITHADDPPWKSTNPPLLGLLNTADAACNPHELLALLASRLDRPPIEHQEVIAHQPDHHAVRLTFTDGALIARHALFCTNAYTSLALPQLAGLITPNRAQMIALHAPAQLLHRSYYANHGSEYFRQPTPDTIILGGKRSLNQTREQTLTDETTPDIQAALEDFALQMLGQRFPVTARWSGPMGFTADSLPLVGPIDTTNRVWLCAGFNGHGMSMAYRTAQIAVNAMLDGEPNPFPLDRLQSLPVAPRPSTGIVPPAAV